MNMFTGSYPRDVDLVLIDGCLDDITSEGVTAPEPLREGMAGPLAISFKDITMRLQFRQEIYEKCHDDMNILLQEVASKFSNPETRIVVTGYYQPVSDRTDFTNAGPIFYCKLQEYIPYKILLFHKDKWCLTGDYFKWIPTGI